MAGMALAALRSRPPSFEDLYRQIELLPEGTTGEILIPGVLETMGRPGRRHRKAAKSCDEFLRGYDADRGGHGWWIEWEVEIRLSGGRLAVPDIAGWRVERVPVLPDENPLAVSPDWCCEVVSPSTGRKDRILKLPLYAECGVEWSWLIHPEQRTVEVFQSVAGKPLLVATKSDDFHGVLPPFDTAVALATFWLPEGGG